MKTPTLRIDLAATDSLGTAWQTSLSPGSADLGRIRLGPTGLIQRVGLWLGLPAVSASNGERVAAADKILDERDDDNQWYSATRTRDRFGAAQWLLAAHDELRSAGWDGQPISGSPRLEAISTLRTGHKETVLPLGIFDLAHVFKQRLQDHALPYPVALQLEQSLDTFAPVVQALLGALDSAGATVLSPPNTEAHASKDSDLGRIQRALLSNERPRMLGDGSVEILTGDTPWEALSFAAERLDDSAVWLVTSEGAMLDEVRRVTDQPSLGISEPSKARPALQVLPLALQLQTSPQDPHAALDLLSLPRSPIPRAIRRALSEAIAKMPAIGSPAWDTALEKALGAYAKTYPDQSKGHLRERVDLYFPVRPPSRVSAARILKVTEAVENWALRTGNSKNNPNLLQAATVARSLAQTIKVIPQGETLDPLNLGQLHDLAIAEGVSLQTQADAGAPACTSDPSGVPSRVTSVAWIGAVSGAAEVGRDTPWSPAERAALKNTGVAISGEGRIRILEQDRWLRPIFAATEKLTFVTWGQQGAETLSQHPLFDILSSKLADGAMAALNQHANDYLRHAGEEIELARAIQMPATWRIPANLLSLKRHWSASGIESLITCPLRWTMEYGAGLRPGTTHSIPDTRTLAGTFAHALFEEVLFEESPGWDVLSADDARDRLKTRFDERIETEAAPLTLPGLEAYKTDLRRSLGDAAAALVGMLKKGGWRPKNAELNIKDVPGHLGGHPFSGFIDLVVEKSDGRVAVIDLKLGGLNYRSNSLRDGTAMQLAVYGKALTSGTSAAPPTAYFILEEGALITTDAADFPGATHLTGPNNAATMHDVERAWDWWGKTLTAGVVVGRGNHLTPDLHQAETATGEQPPDHPWADGKPSCNFCNLHTICQFTRGGVTV